MTCVGLALNGKLKPSVGSRVFPKRPRPKEPFSFGEGLEGREGRGRERVEVCKPAARRSGLVRLLSLAASVRAGNALPSPGLESGAVPPPPPGVPGVGARARGPRRLWLDGGEAGSGSSPGQAELSMWRRRRERGHGPREGGPPQTALVLSFPSTRAVALPKLPVSGRTESVCWPLSYQLCPKSRSQTW